MPLVAAIFLALMASTALESAPSVGLRVLLPTVLPHYCGDGSVFLVQVLANGSMKLNGEYTTRNGLAADSGARRTAFRGEAEQRSGLIPNTIPR